MNIHLITLPKSLKPQNIISQTSTRQDSKPKEEKFKDKVEKETKPVRTTKKWWRKIERHKKDLSNLNPFLLILLQVFESPYLLYKPFTIAKIAKTASRPPKPSYLDFQYFLYKFL